MIEASPSRLDCFDARRLLCVFAGHILCCWVTVRLGVQNEEGFILVLFWNWNWGLSGFCFWQSWQVLLFCNIHHFYLTTSLTCAPRCLFTVTVIPLRVNGRVSCPRYPALHSARPIPVMSCVWSNLRPLTLLWSHVSGTFALVSTYPSLTVQLDIPKPAVQPVTTQFRSISKIDKNSVKQDLAQSITPLTPITDFNRQLPCVLDKHAPLCHRTVCQRKPTPGSAALLSSFANWKGNVAGQRSAGWNQNSQCTNRFMKKSKAKSRT